MNNDIKDMIQRVQILRGEIKKYSLVKMVDETFQPPNTSKEELQKELDGTIKTIIDLMDCLTATESEILTKRFLIPTPKTIRELMDEYSKSYTWVTTTQHKAIVKMQKEIDRRD